MLGKLDTKDYKILKELDKNYRQGFSKIAKKVGLSKNSVSLRFERLQSFISHGIVGINHELLGYKMVKVFYSFDFYDESIEKRIIEELKKHKNILWAARYYGTYDLSICLLVNDINKLLIQINDFNETFAHEINQKEIQIIWKQFYFRHNFLYEESIKEIHEMKYEKSIKTLSHVDKKILSVLRISPRLSLIDIAKETDFSAKTISNRLKYLEKEGIITGYYMTIDATKLDFDTYKLLVRVENLKENKEFEDFLRTIKNIKHFRKMVGLWDYEIDFIIPHINQLHHYIEQIKKKFPGFMKKMSILSFEKRIITNIESFLD